MHRALLLAILHLGTLITLTHALACFVDFVYGLTKTRNIVRQVISSVGKAPTTVAAESETLLDKRNLAHVYKKVRYLTFFWKSSVVLRLTTSCYLSG